MADSYSIRRGEEKAPISTHPAFPAIVALWFAALLGLGSLVLPVALFETLVTATGIAAIVPPAEPPLGFTARAVIALTGAIAGAALGLLLARQVARSQAPEQTGLAPSEMREFRPIFAHDELGEEGLGSFEAAPFAHERYARQPVENNLTTQDETMTEGRDFEPGARSDAEEGEWEELPSPPVPQESEPAAPQLSVVTPIGGEAAFVPPADDRPLEELGLVQLAARLGASIEKRRALKAAAAVAEPQRPAPGAANFEVAEPEDAARAIADFFGPAGHDAEPDRAAIPTAMRTLQIEEDEGDEDDEALAASFSLSLGRASGHGLSTSAEIDEEDELDEDGTDEEEYSSLLAMKNPFSRHEEFVRIDEPELDAGDFEPAVTFPAATPAAPFDLPATPLPEQAAATPGWSADFRENPTDSAAPADPQGMSHDPAEAERGLREALATLQRMNGGA